MSEHTLEVTVSRKHAETEDIRTFELVRPDGGELPPFDAGSHIDVHLPSGLIRQYSLYGDPADRRVYRLGVLRDRTSRGGSAAMHDRVHAGDALTIGAPRNQFKLAEDAPSTLLIAGGIGITPLLSMARRLIALGREFELHYCTRSLDRAAFLDLLGEEALSRRTRLYRDDTGPALDPARLFARQPEETHVYICGPAGFIDWVRSAAQAAGLAPSRIHQEFFSKDETAPAGQAFTVVLKRSGKRFSIPPEHTVVDVLAREGIEIPTSCEQGICGTCVTKVLEGIPDHRDTYFSDEEKAANDQFLPCCSRALSGQLVLDL
jgi:vanillate O-demethylase ferredoxin subunit